MQTSMCQSLRTFNSTPSASKLAFSMVEDGHHFNKELLYTWNMQKPGDVSETQH